MTARQWAQRCGVVALVALGLLVHWKLGVNRAEARERELVQELDVAGHTYTLYFHRKADYFNTIHKDGELVFDGRDHPELRSCIQKLVVIKLTAHRRCYLASRKKTVTEALP